MVKKLSTDVIIIGSGLAGCAADTLEGLAECVVFGFIAGECR